MKMRNHSIFRVGKTEKKKHKKIIIGDDELTINEFMH